MHFLMEFLDFLKIAIFIKPDVIFYCSDIIDETWIRSTYCACFKKKINAIIVVGTHRVPEKLELTFYTLSLWWLQFIKFRVLITASTNIALKKKGKRPMIVHMPHSLVSFNMAYPAGAFDGYNMIFACGEHHMHEIARLNQRESRRLIQAVPVGYGKSDLLVEKRSAIIRKGDQKHILIAPSWGVDNIIERLGEKLIELLLNQNYYVTLRPHPAFYSLKVSHDLSKIGALFAQNPNFTIENPYKESMAIYKADVMISDYSGVAMEFAFLRMAPVLFINVGLKVFNPSWEEWGYCPLEIGIREKIGVVAEPELQDIERALDKIFDQSKQFEKIIYKEREKYCYNFGKCAEQATEVINEILLEKEKWEN